MKILSKLLWLLFITSTISCGGESKDNPIIVPVQRTDNDVREDFSKIEIKTGINDINLESTVEGFIWNFRIIEPEGASTVNKRPLVISLHGAALSLSSDIHKSTACLVEPGFKDLDAYIFSPNSKGYLWFEETSQIQILLLLDLAKRYLHIDESKIVIMGYSDGGNGTWFYAENYSNLFSAAIPIASSHDTANSNGVVNKINIPLYVIHGSEDQLFPLSTTEGYVDKSILAGSDIIFEIADGLEHYNSCEYVPYLKNASTWLDTVIWN